jgi:hypothetical protein
MGGSRTVSLCCLCGQVNQINPNQWKPVSKFVCMYVALSLCGNFMLTQNTTAQQKKETHLPAQVPAGLCILKVNMGLEGAPCRGTRQVARAPGSGVEISRCARGRS